MLLGVVKAGRIPESRLDESVRRLLREKFRLGLFDGGRFVEESAAAIVIGSPENVEAGRRAQQSSVTLLKNGKPSDELLPLRPGIKVYAEGMDVAAFDGVAAVVESPEEADVAVLRLTAPSGADPARGFLGSMHMGSLEFDAEVVAHVNAIAELVPTVVDVFLERPAILTPLKALVLAGSYGTDDAPFVDVLFGAAKPLGKLPFDLPRSMAAVEGSREDVPFDTVDPLFTFGHGLRYDE